MLAAQLWVRFYDGEYVEHPNISGTYMRAGRGIQHWVNGQIFDGNWENHVYHGVGTLWRNKDHWERRSAPLYSGEWQRGFRHGFGTMRYEQDMHDHRGSKALKRGHATGINKVYEGQFRNGLFHGDGVLKVEKAVAQQLPGRSRNTLQQRPGFVPLPNLDPSLILRYEGSFLSDWKTTDEATRKDDPVFASCHPPLMYPPLDKPKAPDERQMDYNLHELTRFQKKRQRFIQFFDVDANNVQKAGQMIPDLATAAYALKGGEAMHMREARSCKYADGTVYEGQFVEGKPSSIGEPGTPNKTRQYEIQSNGALGSTPLATYEGGFLNGARNGNGTYTTADGLVYKGEWKDNKRNGYGEQTAKSMSQRALGYSSYKGQWKDDQRDGQGEMVFENGSLLFEGTFVRDLRHDKGSVFRINSAANNNNNKILICRGEFLNDMPTTEKPVWSHLVEAGNTRGRFYYGTVDSAGQRTGKGTLYDEDADGDENFLRCFESGEPYTAENPDDHDNLKYISYHGEFNHDEPHGDGLQHFSKQGFYVGQFHRGLRQGRGTWTSTDGNWTYRPISDTTVPNWEKDEMHGVGIVEDSEHVFENVVYIEGRCQMPFTNRGPPKTGLESTVVVGTMLQKRKTLVDKQKVGPSASMAKKKRQSRISKWMGYQEDNDQGWSPTESEFMKAATKSMSNRLSAKFKSDEDSDDAGLVDLREETDIILPEEDVLITGGTGQNATINGLYFKMSATYGTPVYKMVKKQSKFFYSVPVARFLYFDTVTNVWVISALPNEGPKQQPGCAYVDDPDATHPGAITAAWYVYCPDDKRMREFGAIAEEEDEEDEPAGASSKMISAPVAPVDQIRCVSIMGFGLTGVENTLIKACLMVRLDKELYGRPVYGSDSDDLYLYWMKKTGDFTQGLLDEHLDSDDLADPSTLFKYTGHWIIAEEVGERCDGPTCLACLEDSAVSPDQIPQGSSWLVAVSQNKPQNPGAGYRYERSSVFGLILQEVNPSDNFDD
jgi:hypothetical protein